MVEVTSRMMGYLNPILKLESKFRFGKLNTFLRKEKMKPNEKMMLIALKEFGVKEISGQDHNKRIIQYAKEAGFDWVDSDEIAWCSIFVNWVALKAGVERTNLATARSWLDIGEWVKEPEIGDIVVFKRGNSKWQGHVGLFVNYAENGDINVFGGNQWNQVNIKDYKKDDFLGFIRLSYEKNV